MTRYNANRLILNYLQRCIKKYPNLRFNQILIKFGFIVIDGGVDYYLESEYTWRCLYEKKKNKVDIH